MQPPPHTHASKHIKDWRDSEWSFELPILAILLKGCVVDRSKRSSIHFSMELIAILGM